MLKNICFLLSIILNCSFLSAADITNGKVDAADEDFVNLDETLMKVENINISKKNKEDKFSKRGYKWLKNVYKLAAAHDDFVNLAAVYFLARDRQMENLSVCGMVWAAAIIPIEISAILTMGIGMVGVIPIAGVSLGFGVQSHKYRKLKQRAKQLLISLDNDTFTKINQAWQNGDLSKLGGQQVKQYEKERLERIEQDHQIKPTYSYYCNYEGLKCLLSRRGYDVAKAIVY